MFRTICVRSPRADSVYIRRPVTTASREARHCRVSYLAMPATWISTGRYDTSRRLSIHDLIRCIVPQGLLSVSIMLDFDSKIAAAQPLRPIYIVVVFWGDANRNYFATMLLPSLLAPRNLPAIVDVTGSKIVICTTRYDWHLLQQLPLFKEVKTLIEILHIEIPFPSRSANKYTHSSFAFKRAIDVCWKNRAYASLLSPDVILADGTLAYLRGKVESGAKAVLAPALRFDLEKCKAALKANGIIEVDKPVVVSPRELAAIAEKGLHSEIQRFEWDASYFCRQPISVWRRLRGCDGIVVHTTSWAMALVSFDALSEVQSESLDRMTLDAVFILENFFKFRESGGLHLVTDSDDMLMLPLTSESDVTFLPLRPLTLNFVPLLGTRIKFWNLRLYLASEIFDAFRRWAVTIPTFIHSRPLSNADARRAAATTRLLRRATLPPRALLRFYGRLPRWGVLRTLVILLLWDSGRHWLKRWRGKA
jgi:hypothetical protein